MKKLVPQKIASRTNTEDIFQEHKDQNRKHSTPMISQHTQNALTTQKIVAVYFKDVKIEETFSSQDQKLVETTNLWRQLSSDKKTPQRKSASATIAYPVELMIGTTMNSSRLLNYPHTVLEIEKICTTKNRIKDEHKKRHISETKIPKFITQKSHEQSAYPQRTYKPKKQRCVFHWCQNWRSLQ